MAYNSVLLHGTAPGNDHNEKDFPKGKATKIAE